MASQTYIADGLFTQLRMIALLRSLDVVEHVDFPFDQQFAAQMKLHESHWQKLLNQVQVICGFSDSVMLRERDISIWYKCNQSSSIFGSDALAADLLFAADELLPLGTGLSCRVNFEDRTTLHNLIVRGLRLQIAALFESLLEGWFCFSTGSDVSPDSLRQFLKDLATFLGRSAPWPLESFHSEVVQQWSDSILIPSRRDGTLSSDFSRWLDSTILGR